jgi:hypothetical protein
LLAGAVAVRLVGPLPTRVESMYERGMERIIDV